jgi:uncharacterized repeat protein (TIGR03803 family)
MRARIGLTASLVSLIAGIASAASESALYHFTSGTGGDDRISGLVRGKDGALYGDSYRGGASGGGEIFRLTPPAAGKTAWAFTLLRSYPSSQPGLQGSLAIDAAGALYGTNSTSGPQGNGSVFKLTPTASGKAPWRLTTLYDFAGLGNGYAPIGPVVMDKSGALYGTAQFGGAKEGLVGYFGLVFKLTPPHGTTKGWTMQQIYSFGGGADGGFPVAGVIFDTKGNLYGTTQYGGTNNNGVVFKLTPPPSGAGVWKETVLYRFPGGLNGSQPVAGLAIDATGALYGTTMAGGSASDNGIAFKLTPPKSGAAWTETVLHRFSGGADGGLPMAGVTISGGSLYGTTEVGGVLGNGGNSAGNGVIYKLTPPAKGTLWVETVEHDFAKGADATDGTNPTAGLIPNGKAGFFGTTSGGLGESLNGTIYELTP